MLVLISSSISTFGQSQQKDTFYLVELPQQTKEIVIKRILANYFKSTDKPKVIYIAEKGIEKQWLPFIKNIEFRLISREEAEQRKISVYLFSDIWENTPGLYQITFGYGDPDCKYLGDIWNFRESNPKVRVWRKRNGQVGGRCSHPSQNGIGIPNYIQSRKRRLKHEV